MIHRVRRHGVAIALCGLLTAAAIAPAAAQPAGPAAAALEAWVTQIDELPEVRAVYETLTGEGDEAILTGLTILGSGVAMAFEPIRVEGYRAVGESGFAFASFMVDRVQSRTPTTEVNIINLSVLNIVVPDTAFVYDETRPLSSILDIWGQASGISVDEIAMGRIDIGQYYGGLDSLVSYHNYVIRGWADGRIAETSAGPLVMHSPADEPIFVLTVDSLISEDIDIGALAWVLDPAAYAGGNRDWRTVLGHAEYNNILVGAPDIQMRIRSISIDDFEVRQAAEPFLPVLERLMTDTELNARDAEALSQQILLDLISPWGLGEIAIVGLDIYADDIERFHLGEFHIAGLSLDGLNEIGFSDLDVIVEDEGFMRLGFFAIGGIEMPDEKVLDQALAVIAAGGDIDDFRQIVPDVGYIEVRDLAIAEAEALPITLDGLLVTGGGEIAGIPTEGRIEILGLGAPVTLFDTEVRRVLNELGFTELTVSLGIYVTWNEATETLRLEDLYVAIPGAGSITATFEIGGVTREMMEATDEVDEDALNALSLIFAELRIVDESVADRLFQWTAEGTNTPPAQYRDEFIRGLPVVLALTIDRAIAAQVAPPIQQFLREPSELVVTITPDAPVPLIDVMAAVERSPFGLLTLLGVELTVTPLN